MNRCLSKRDALLMLEMMRHAVATAAKGAVPERAIEGAWIHLLCRLEADAGVDEQRDLMPTKIREMAERRKGAA
jgi:hypothetical protein